MREEFKMAQRKVDMQKDLHHLDAEKTPEIVWREQLGSYQCRLRVERVFTREKSKGFYCRIFFPSAEVDGV